jgi:hypothetical protein
MVNVAFVAAAIAVMSLLAFVAGGMVGEWRGRREGFEDGEQYGRAMGFLEGRQTERDEARGGLL